MESISTALPTHLEAKNALDSLISSFSDSREMKETDIKTATLGIAHSLQIRDYALGSIGLTFDNLDALDFVKGLELLGEVSPCLLAIKASIYFEAEDLTEANLALDKAFALDPNHPLSLLLRRVFAAGWPPASFASMRDSLHPKVIEGLKELEGVSVDAK
jgi:hypothetical protein